VWPDLHRWSGEPARTAAALTLIALFGAAIELHYGRLGFMPIDQSTVFDGGWRTLNGQLPFRDYTTPNAITPSLLQGLVFWILGVSWFTYVLHAAIFNSLFGIVVYVLLRLVGGSRISATAYALMSTVVFYPPIGVPFHDQHSFFFSLLALTLAVAAIRSPASRRQRVGWTLAAASLCLAYLSKQTPAVLTAPVLIGLAATAPHRRRALTALAAGFVASTGFLVVTAAALGLRFDLIRVYFFELPLLTGRERGQNFDLTDLVLAGVLRLTPQLVTPVVAWIGALMLIAVAIRDRNRRPDPDAFRIPALALGLLWICNLFTDATLNQPEEGIPLIFAALGLVQVGATNTVSRYGHRAVVAVAAVLLTVGVADSIRFAITVDADRTVNDMTYEQAPPAVEAALPSRLSFLRWDVAEQYTGQSPASLNALTTRLKEGPGNFLLLGDTAILYGLSGRPSTFPALFQVQGLTVPERTDPAFAAFERRLLEAVTRHDVRRIVVEPSYDDFDVASFPGLDALVAKCRGPERRYGTFRVIELRTPC